MNVTEAGRVDPTVIESERHTALHELTREPCC